MFSVLQIVTVTLVAMAMAMALAHALEFPGKMRLDKQTYYAVQPIYYPGFTIGGGIGEVGGTISTIVPFDFHVGWEPELLANARCIGRTGRYASGVLAVYASSE